MQTGLNINLVEKTTGKEKPIFSFSKNIHCEPLELCLLLSGLIENPIDIKLVKLNIRIKEIDIYTAFDIAIAIEECKNKNIFFIGFSEHLSLSNILAICFCDIRICPPLAGPLTFNLNFKHFKLQASEKYFKHTKIGSKKLSLFDFASDEADKGALEEERDLGDVIILKCIQLILKAVPQTKPLKESYSTAVELIETHLLTHVCYEEYLAHNIPALRTVKWKSINISYTDLHSIWFKLKNFVHKTFYIIEIKSNYLNETQLLDDLRQKLLILYHSKRVHGVLLIVNYKGGSYDLADRIWCLISVLNKRIPVYIYIKVATSSGYCIASAGAKIFINPCGYLGNIGTIIFSINGDKILYSVGIDVFNNISSPLKYNQTAEALLKSRAEIAHKLFINRISLSRNVDVSLNSSLMDGSYFNSTQAITAKLADTEETFISILNFLTSQERSKLKFVLIKNRGSFFNNIFDSFISQSISKLLKL